MLEEPSLGDQRPDLQRVLDALDDLEARTRLLEGACLAGEALALHGLGLGHAMAQAIGAQKAFPGRQVVSLSGDGGFTVLMGDFISLMQLNLPVKVVVFNNGSLGFVGLEQKSTGFLDYGTDLANPNFAAMAQAMGIRGIRLDTPAEVEDGIADALAHNGPVLVDAVVNRSELAMPPSITIEMAKGFSLYMVKAILNGRTDEIVDLAKTNLWG